MKTQQNTPLYQKYLIAKTKWTNNPPTFEQYKAWIAKYKKGEILPKLEAAKRKAKYNSTKYEKPNYSGNSHLPPPWKRGSWND